QEKDERIFNLKKMIAQVPLEKEKAQEEISRAEEICNTAKEKQHLVRKQIQGCEEDIKKAQDQITQLNIRASSSRDNNEYRDLMRQIDELREKISGYEDQELDLMEKQEEVKVAFENTKRELEATKKRVEAYCQDLDQRKTNCERQIEQLLGEREKLVAEIPEDLYRRYQRLIQQNNEGGVFRKAIVPVVDNCCGFCHLSVTPDLRVKIKAGKEIVTCINCGTFLYSENE
ncbi:MAG: hypothetical protein D6820_18900, partial [Lentisphaerae bacterium]